MVFCHVSMAARSRQKDLRLPFVAVYAAFLPIICCFSDKKYLVTLLIRFPGVIIKHLLPKRSKAEV